MNNLQIAGKKAVHLELDHLPDALNNFEINPERKRKNNALQAEKPAQTLYSFDRLQRVYEEAIRAMGVMMEVRDPYTAGHQQRVSCICVEISKELSLPAQEVKGIQMAALIHDIGKLAFPAEILSKPGKLSDAEFDLIKTHPSVGYGIIKDIEFPWPIAQIILQHHERMNGSGYPAKLSSDNIPLEARILSVADVIEAMASNRPYRPSKGLNMALEEISNNKNILYDGDVVDACLKLFCTKGFNLASNMLY